MPLLDAPRNLISFSRRKDDEKRKSRKSSKSSGSELKNPKKQDFGGTHGHWDTLYMLLLDAPLNLISFSPRKDDNKRKSRKSSKSSGSGVKNPKKLDFGGNHGR